MAVTAWLRKLEALGIRTGKGNQQKFSGQLMRGPVLLQHNHTQAAVGFGMASRVLVEVNGGGLSDESAFNGKS